MPQDASKRMTERGYLKFTQTAKGECKLLAGGVVTGKTREEGGNMLKE